MKTSKVTQNNGPSAESIASVAKNISKKGTPPVHLWDPPFCGDLDIRIARDGTWYYLGTPIGRFELVKLFSSILRKDEDKYFLVTPVEKVGIKVDDAPFVAVDFSITGSGSNQTLIFETQVGDRAKLDKKNKLRVSINQKSSEPKPYIHIRSGLEALIDRKSFYRLIEIGSVKTYKNDEWFGIWSDKNFFPIILASELN
tara:strand:+ start:167 stop:763 length:597 start_codon:yes stop_codon:yes gene_type:complete